ncbi:MAG: PD40 domain-containing protein [Anaerolineae bacterium]|nr:PD40 domain-containing protein [Anaerolineae bacterium]
MKAQTLTYRWSLLLVLVMLAAACVPAPAPEVPEVAVLPTASETDAPVLISETPAITATASLTPSITYTSTATWTPYIIVGTYTPSLTYTPSMTFTPSLTYTPSNTFTPTKPPTWTPTQDQPAPVVMAVAPDVPGLVTPRDSRCAPTTTTLTANIDTSVGLYTLRLNYVYNGGQGQVVDMYHAGDNLYTAELGPFDQPGQVAYWLSMADNWGKWTTSDPQTLDIADCDVDALNATAAAAATNALTATALAQSGGTNPLAFRGQDLDLSTPYQTPITVTLAAVNGTPPYTFLINSNPANGTLTIIDQQTVEYRPNNGFVGDDTFTYLVTDYNGMADVAVVRITIGTISPIDKTVNVPFNATDFPITLEVQNGVPPYVTSITSGPNGTLTPDPGDPLRYLYTPPTGFIGTTSFDWEVTDSAPAIGNGTITLNVGAPAATGRIVFAANTSGDWEIYTMNPDGTGITNVSQAPGSDEQWPSFSPDRSQITFASNADGDYDIYTMPAGGSLASATNLTNSGSSDVEPAWSPSGSYIAFASDRDNGDYDIYRILSGGGGTTQRLTSTLDEDRDPAWSPDSATLAFSREPAGGGNTQIYRRPSTDAGSATALTSSGSNVEPAWSSDGSQIAFASNRDGNYEIYAMNTDGSGQAAVLSAAGDDRAPVWSPDGLFLAYHTSGGIQRILIDGSNQTPLAEGQDADWR